jgi:hypothetical protein
LQNAFCPDLKDCKRKITTCVKLRKVAKQNVEFQELLQKCETARVMEGENDLQVAKEKLVVSIKGLFISGPIWSWAHLELSPLGLEVGLNFSPTLQSGP